MRASLAEIAEFLRYPGRPDTAVHLAAGPGSTLAACSDGTLFPSVHGQPVLIDFERSVVRRADIAAGAVRSLVARKPHSRLRRLAKAAFPSTRRSASNLATLANVVRTCGPAPLVLVVGGGTLGEGAAPLYGDESIRVVAFDVYASADTAFVADGHAIPLADACVDAVVVQAVLEHVVDPFRIVAEIARVLRPGGYVYAETPFLQHVHEGAYDFWRFTESGHRLLFGSFEPIARGALGGAGLSTYWALRALMRDLTRSRTLGAILSAPFLPLVMIDRILPETRLIDSANGVFFLGRKVGVASTRLDPTQIYLGHQRCDRPDSVAAPASQPRCGAIGPGSARLCSGDSSACRARGPCP